MPGTDRTTLGVHSRICIRDQTGKEGSGPPGGGMGGRRKSSAQPIRDLLPKQCPDVSPRGSDRTDGCCSLLVLCPFSWVYVYTCLSFLICQKAIGWRSLQGVAGRMRWVGGSPGRVSVQSQTRESSVTMTLLVTDRHAAIFLEPSRDWPRCRTMHRGLGLSGSCATATPLLLINLR